MSTRKSKKRKASGPNHTPEVFVLSPELLHKLGIDIAKIQTLLADNSSDSVIAQDEVFKKPRSTKRTNKTIEESSVMTTATLMKESVLLSPSFINPVEYQGGIENIPVSSPSINSPGNVHILPTVEFNSKSQEKDHLKPTPGNTLHEDPSVTPKADPINVLKENDVSGNALNERLSQIPQENNISYNLDQSCSDLQYHIQAYMKENELFDPHNYLPCNKKKVTMSVEEDRTLITLNDLNIDDDHLDEAYSSDCSNGNNTISPVSAEFNLEPPSYSHISEQKINILSEEVIDDSRLNEMISKSLSPSIKDKLIPVSVDTIMSFKRNVPKADTSPDAIEYKSNLNCQNQSLSANVSIEQVSTADESFLDNIITGVMKMDEIDINILEVSDSDLNTQNLSNSVYINMPEDSECNKLENTSEITSGADNKNRTRENQDIPTYNLQCDTNIEIKNISKEMFKKRNQDESNSDILMEFIEKYPEVKDSTLNQINTDEYDSAIISQIEAYVNTSHDTLFRETNPLIINNINNKQHTDVNTIESGDIIDKNQVLTANNIKEYNIVEKEQNMQEKVVEYTIKSGAAYNDSIVNDEGLETPSEPVTEMSTNAVCHCKCNIINSKATLQVKHEASNGKNEKMHEIASYLKMFVENKLKKASTIYSNCRPANFSSQAVLKPKPCVHGVEKPGGSNEDKTRREDDLPLTRDANQMPRTYKRNKSKIKPIKPQATISNAIFSDEKDINISDSIMAETVTDNFCLCGDYGIFDFYGFEVNPYSHIHFWNNMTIDFDIVEWFSEFDYIAHVEKNVIEGTYCNEVPETKENILDPICWVGWNRPEKTKADQLLLFNVDVSLQMSKDTTEIDLPVTPIEISEINDLNNIYLENAQTKMVDADNETVKSSLSQIASQIETTDDADDSDDYCEVYQVIECSDELETVQADLPDVKITKNPETQLGADFNVLVSDDRESDEYNVRQFLTHYKRPDIDDVVCIKQSKFVNDKSYDCPSNKDELTLPKKKNIKNTIAAEPESKIQTVVVQNKKNMDSKPKVESIAKTTTKNNNIDLLGSNSMQKSGPKALIDVVPKFKLNETESLIKFNTSLGDNISSDLNKTTTSRSKRQAKRNPRKDIEEVEVKGTNISTLEGKASNNFLHSTVPKDSLNTSDRVTVSKQSQSKLSSDVNVDELMEVKTVLQIENVNSGSLMKSSRKRSDNIELELTEGKEEVSQRPKRQASEDNKPESKSKANTESEKIISTDAVHDIKTNESYTRRQSRNAKTDEIPEVIADKLHTFTKTDKILKTDAVHDLKTNDPTIKRQSRNSNKDIEPETDKIINTDAVLPLKTYESKTRLKSRNAVKHSEPKLGAGVLNSLKKTDEIPNTDALKDLKTNEATTAVQDLIIGDAMTKKRSRNVRKDIEPKLDAKELKSFKEIDKKPNTDDAMDLKTNEMTTQRQTPNVKKDIEPETDAINHIEIADALKTNESKTRRQSRNTGKDIKPETDKLTKTNAVYKVVAEQVNSFKKTDKTPKSDDVQSLKTNELKTRRQSRNAKKEIKPETDKITNNDAVQSLIPNNSATRQQSRNAKKDVKVEVDAEELNSLENIDKIPNTDAIKTNEATTTRRQYRNTKKDIEPELDAEELIRSKETTITPVSIDVIEMKTNETTSSRRQFRNTKKEIQPESDKITTMYAVQGLQTNDSKTRRQSRDMKVKINSEELNSAKEADKITNIEVVHVLTPKESTTRRHSRNGKKYIKPKTSNTDAVQELVTNEATTADIKIGDIKLEVNADELNSLSKEDNQTSNHIKTSDVTRRRSCRHSLEKIDPDASEAKKKKTETTPPRSRRSKKTKEQEHSQKYLKVQEIAKTYASKKDKERNASDEAILDLALDRTPSKRKRSTVKSIDTTPTNIRSTLSVIDVASPNNAPQSDISMAPQLGLSIGPQLDPNIASQLDLSIAPLTSEVATRIIYPIECGVCDAEVEGTWIHHIAANHFYLAWKKGDPVLDLNNPGAVDAHLKIILQETKKLKCSRCGLQRKNPKIFLDHIKNCDKSDDEDMALSKLKSKKTKKCKSVGDTKTCAMCKEEIGVREWEAHVMFTHYNLAWAVGDSPNNLKDANLICRLLKEYKAAGGRFACNLCGLTRSSALGFYAHAVACGKSDEEMEEHMECCDQCQKPYLAIHRQPHMAWHKQQQIKKEAKVLEPEVKIEEVEEESEAGGRKRKAARKAVAMIQKLESHKDDSLSCRRCDFIGSTREALKSHKCKDAGTFVDQGDESEDSLEFASDHSDDDDDNRVSDDADDADAINISEDEKDNRRKKKNKSEHVSKYERMPFELSSEAADTYVENGSKLFFNQHFSDEVLFAKWRHSEYKVLNETEIATYTPPVAESCKFATAHKWTTLKRFESVKHPVLAFFAGGCPGSMCWVPGRLRTSPSERNYLALATYLGPDQPRYSSLKHYTSPGTLLQIWDFGHTPYSSCPKLSMCIAMDKGTVWSMCWCPSGARDGATGDDAAALGLVAVACSDGRAYVYSVPHPARVHHGKDPVFVKLNPVAELRLYYNPEKQICQASKIFWSMQKGHEVVAVGYSNGIVAFFDLCAESPLTRKCEGDRDIFYPYFSQQAHWSCITGMSMFPGREGGGVWAAGSSRGGALGGAGTACARLNAAAADTPFLPLWPSALLLNDDSNTSDIDFGGVVRKFSAATAAAGCLRCSKLAQFSSPLLKTMCTHPAYKDMRKSPVLLIQMRRLKRDTEDVSEDSSKDNHKSSNEPSTYEKAIEEYGIRIKFCKRTDRISCEKEFNPGRFPLSEVSAMAFCPTHNYHHWLAVATHSGLVFFINTS